MTAAIHPRANVNPKIRPSETFRQIRETVEAMRVVLSVSREKSATVSRAYYRNGALSAGSSGDQPVRAVAISGL